jgi:hypothetical protein
MVMVILAEDEPKESWLKLVSPSGEIGYAAANSFVRRYDQLCYQKDGGGWKIIGYIGTGAGRGLKGSCAC